MVDSGLSGVASYPNPVNDADSHVMASTRPQLQKGRRKLHESADTMMDGAQPEGKKKDNILGKVGELARNAAAVGVNHLENTLHVDIDRDGDVGVVNVGSVGSINVDLQRIDDTFTVIVRRAKDLKFMSPYTANDVFVGVTLGEVTQLTSTVQNGGSDPAWGDTGEGECLAFSLADAFPQAPSGRNTSTSGRGVIDIGKVTATMKITVFDRVIDEDNDGFSNLAAVDIVKLQRLHRCIGVFEVTKVHHFVIC